MAMLDWLRRSPDTEPSITLGEVTLPIVIRRLAHARRLTLRLAPDGSEVRLSMPQWSRTADALDFVRSRQGWLKAQLVAVPATAAPTHGSGIAYRGELLRLEHDSASTRRVRLDDAALWCGGPAENLPARLRRWLEGEARRLLAADLADYCARAGKPVPKLALSGATRRWGSCSAKGAIRINWRLIMAPDFVRRSVVAHEVAHLVHFDHSPAFHALLADLFEGDLRAANRWLKRDGRGLYAAFG